MDSISVLIAGKAGFGIDTAGLIIARILNQLGYRIYIYRDYPSLIRGGHTFSIVRASSSKIAAHLNKVDFLLALNQDAVNFHKDKLRENSVFLFDSDAIKPESLPLGLSAVGVPLGKLIKEENAPEIMRNTCIIGSFCKVAGIDWSIAEGVLRRNVSKEIDLNLKVALKGFNETEELEKINVVDQKPLPIITGNVAIALGLVKGGLKTYIAYPMTPSSSILHFLASTADDFSLKVIHPENEIGVMLMALGASYMGEKVAVGTSGGGFCLMTEGLSFSGTSELPVVIFVGQRPGPSTGLPTHSTQSDLSFILSAGQGEFPRMVVAPGDSEEAYYFSALALNMAWKFQVPAIILSDKTLSEGTYSFDLDSIKEIKEEEPILWDRSGSYKRYMDTETGVSPLAFATEKDAIVKINSYEHDEFGITTEKPELTKKMQDKRLRKEKYLLKELEKYEIVKVYGNINSPTALICWGSNKGVCSEVASTLGLKVIMPLVLKPFPVEQFKVAFRGVEKAICVENNATGQLAGLLSVYGFEINDKILKYDGRPFTTDELEEEVKKVIK